MNRRKALITCAAIFSLTFAAPKSFAAPAKQDFPSKPISWVVGFPPGGGADSVTRLVAAKVEESIGQPIVVERAGLSGHRHRANSWAWWRRAKLHAKSSTS
jgi:tripartite-type tricarboxylate transporter receptor subunit TctC